jgi:hypothetical protein
MLKKLSVLWILVSGSLNAIVCPSDCHTCAEPCNDLCGFFFGAEGLYWTACQDNLEYASDINGEPFLVGPGKTHSLHYDWKGGVRGWLGWHCDGGEGRFVYTWIKNEADGHKHSEDNIDLIALLVHPGTNQSIASFASGENEFEYQTLDMLFGNNLSYCCNKIFIHPFYGVRALKIRQDFSMVYSGLDFETPTIITARSLLKAAGVNAGVDFQYTIFKHLGVYGGFGGSILAGRIESHQKQFSVGELLFREVDLDDDLRVCVPGYQISAGLTWYIHCHRYFTFLLSAGYEFSHWFRVPTTRRFYDDVNHGVSGSVRKGEMTLHGATLSIVFAF